MLILSSFCHYIYPSISKSKLHKTYEDIVGKENQITYEISKNENCEYLDVSSMLSRSDKYFVDSVHFSPEGMKVLAKIMATKILNKKDTKHERK